MDTRIAPQQACSQAQVPQGRGGNRRRRRLVVLPPRLAFGRALSAAEDIGILAFVPAAAAFPSGTEFIYHYTRLAIYKTGVAIQKLGACFRALRLAAQDAGDVLKPPHPVLGQKHLPAMLEDLRGLRFGYIHHLCLGLFRI